MREWNRTFLLCASCTAMLAFAQPLKAAVVVLDFEGVGNFAAINDFYNGGTDSSGRSGANYGVSFSPATLGLVDEDAGGGGNFANEPSPSTVMFFLDANNAILNYGAGFDTGFSFYYSSSTATSVKVFSGFGASGNLLATLNLAAQGFQNCSGDPAGDFCNWSPIGVSFTGVARSIDFGGTANYTGFDDITFGSATAGGVVPEPASWAMMIVGFGAVGYSLRRRRTQERLPHAI